MRNTRAPKRELPKHLAEAIHKAWPDDIIEPLYIEEAPFWHTYPDLQAALRNMPGANLFYEQKPQEEQQWDGEVDEYPPDSGPRRSYHMFFVHPRDDRFRYVAQTLEEDEEDGLLNEVEGEGWTGCIAAVSLVAPVAVVTPGQAEVFESGWHSITAVPHIYSPLGTKRQIERYFLETFDEEILEGLRQLQAGIIPILSGFGITPIPEDDLTARVPWLRRDEDVLGQYVRRITVRDAFFFEML